MSLKLNENHIYSTEKLNIKIQKKQRVLFICTHNSARSQMAEGLLKTRFGDLYNVLSAGTNPTKINPYAVFVLREIGIDISGQQSKNLTEFLDKKFDIVVTVCDSAKESCPFFPGGRILHRGFQDPSVVRGTEEEKLAEFRRSRDEIDDWIKKYFTPQ